MTFTVPILLKRIPPVAWPVTFGIPIPRGLDLPCDGHVQFNDRSTPCQVTPLAHWSDSSPKWLLILFVVQPDAPEHAELVFSDHPPNWNGQPQKLSAWLDASITIQLWNRRTLIPEGFYREVSQYGPICCQVRERCQFDKRLPLRLWREWSYYPTLELACLRITIRNGRRARHRNGLWDLGDPGSVWIRNLRVTFPFEVRESELHVEDQCYTFETPGWRLVQASSGGQFWNSPVHVSADGHVHLPYAGYRVYVENQSAKKLITSGARAQPSVVVFDQDGQPWTVATDAFWQQFPQSITWQGQRVYWISGRILIANGLGKRHRTRANSGLSSCKVASNKRGPFGWRRENARCCRPPANLRWPLRIRSTWKQLERYGRFVPLVP